ncbi:hypothetical protein PLESTM_000675000 [Pleodorina starrii]|nr:hypothetical protein PLESTM_000675000 [Pleodorina starrii]
MVHRAPMSPTDTRGLMNSGQAAVAAVPGRLPVVAAGHVAAGAQDPVPVGRDVPVLHLRVTEAAAVVLQTHRASSRYCGRAWRMSWCSWSRVTMNMTAAAPSRSSSFGGRVCVDNSHCNRT